MTEHRDKTHRPPRPVKSTKASDAGYGRPPKQHQFKPGKSGNPKGRPKGSVGESTMLREIMEHTIETHSNGRARRIPVMKGILLRVTEDSLKGNIKSAAFLLNRYAALVTGELRAEDLSDDDKEILEAFARRHPPKNNGEST